MTTGYLKNQLYGMCWLFFMLTRRKQKPLEKREPNLRKCFHNIKFWQTFVVFSQLVIDAGRAQQTESVAIPIIMVLGSIIE